MLELNPPQNIAQLKIAFEATWELGYSAIASAMLRRRLFCFRCCR